MGFRNSGSLPLLFPREGGGVKILRIPVALLVGLLTAILFSIYGFDIGFKAVWQGKEGK